MKTWPFVAVVAALCILAGCRVDPHILLLERQNRMLEDEIYRLRAELEECYPATQDYQMPTGADTLAPRATAAPAATSGGAPSGIPLNVDLSGATEYTEPPRTLQLRDGSNSTDPAPEAETVPTPRPEREELEEAPRFPQSGSQNPNGAEAAQVTGIALGRLLCGGYDADGKPGDDGITVVLRPRDADGRLVEVPGEVAVVLLDPALTGEAARVGRWDFTAEETARRFRREGPERGIHLETRWPAAPPLHGELHLFIRYTTSDGRRFEVDRPIEVALSAERPSRWVLADPLPEPAAAQPRVRIPNASRGRAATGPAEAAVRRPAWSAERP